MAAVAVAGWSLSGCGSVTDRTRDALVAVTPYKVEVVQGNFVSKEQVELLKPGLSRQQVREILGTSLLTDVFHPDRWDYVFRFQYPNGEAELRRVTIQFANDRVAEIKADPLPQRDDPNDPALPGHRPNAG